MEDSLGSGDYGYMFIVAPGSDFLGFNMGSAGGTRYKLLLFPNITAPQELSAAHRLQLVQPGRLRKTQASLSCGKWTILRLQQWPPSSATSIAHFAGLSTVRTAKLKGCG